MRVYFMRPIGLAGPVKIGCSKAPDQRLSVYASWSPFPLEIVATIDGEYELERRFHARFAFLHSHGEWFKGHPDLSRTIMEISQGRFDVGSLPPARDVRKRVRSDLSRVLCGLGGRLRKLEHLAPDDVLEAKERTCWLRKQQYPDRLADAAVVWRFCEKMSPQPDSYTSRTMRRLLAERATPTADTAA